MNVLKRTYGSLHWRATSFLRQIRARQQAEQEKRAQVQNLITAAQNANPLRVILGSGGTTYEGWIPTDVHLLDITNPTDWQRYFKPNTIQRMLAEHVLEHLSEQQNRAGLALCYQYLAPGGIFRIAVPDGNRLDAAYQAEVRPPKDGHQMLFTLEKMTALLEEAGFTVRPLEYFDRDEQFHATSWDSADGHVMRSVRFDRQKDFQRGELYYTSLIVDAVKPS
ncbi:MAG: hypothetical protein SF029_21085 [bacterium]|nr:hypothetical protein [bacterium]